MSEKLGTVWVAPGMGATGADLVKAIGTMPTDDRVFSLLWLAAIQRVNQVNLALRTNLALTGEPLTGYDLRRIAVCD